MTQKEKEQFAEFQKYFSVSTYKLIQWKKQTNEEQKEAAEEEFTTAYSAMTAKFLELVGEE